MADYLAMRTVSLTVGKEDFDYLLRKLAPNATDRPPANPEAEALRDQWERLRLRLRPPSGETGRAVDEWRIDEFVDEIVAEVGGLRAAEEE